MILFKFFLPFVAFLSWIPVGHTDLHDGLLRQIRQKTKEIEAHPKDANLYFERGYLYQLHEDYRKALQDYNVADMLGFVRSILAFRKAEVYYLLRDYDSALSCLKWYQERAPKDVLTSLLESRILREKGEVKAAIPVFHHFIQEVEDLTPENVLEYSELISSNGDLTSAIEAIEEGMHRLSTRPPTLLLREIQLYSRLGANDQVEKRYNELILTGGRKEHWYYEKARFLHQIHRDDKAEIALMQAGIELESLPDRLKNGSAMQELQQKISSLKKEINPK